jgi:hypothetical protein
MYFEAKNILNSNCCQNIKHYFSVFGIVIKVFFKVFFAWKYIKIIFLFLKIYFRYARQIYSKTKINNLKLRKIIFKNKYSQIAIPSTLFIKISYYFIKTSCE